MPVHAHVLFQVCVVLLKKEITYGVCSAHCVRAQCSRTHFRAVHLVYLCRSRDAEIFWLLIAA